ncbi:MAG: cytochrome c biogenesis protein CcdA [bacterium]|nr:cytochrome c biogenesis protein CcdA [bacterium]
MKSKLIILVLAITVLMGTAVFLGNSSDSSRWLWDLSQNGKWLLPLVTISALIDSINPCAFSILLLTIAFLFNLGKMRGSILKIGGSYIFGLFTVYVLIGLGILQALHIFNTPHFMAKVGASLLIILGLINLINQFFPKFPIKLKIPDAAHHKMAQLMEKALLPTAFALGILVGLCEFPCTGGPYLMVLGLLHDKVTFTSGLSYLFLYNLIFILPLVIILAIASNKVLLEKVQNWKKEKTGQMRLYGGMAMILLGLLMFLL